MSKDESEKTTNVSITSAVWRGIVWGTLIGLSSQFLGPLVAFYVSMGATGVESRELYLAWKN